MRTPLLTLALPLTLALGTPAAAQALPVPRPLPPRPGPAVPVPGPAGEERAEADDDPAKSARSAAESPPPAAGGDEARADDEESLPSLGSGHRQRPPNVTGARKVHIDMVDAPLTDVVKFMADITGRNFILTDQLKGSVTIISERPVTVGEAYEAFLSALEMAGYTTVTVGKATKIVPTGEAASSPIRVHEGDSIPYTDNFVTQIIQLENVSVADVSSVVKDLAGKGAKVIAYSPTNTLIITDAATNIRRIYRIVSQLDVASPKTRIEIIPLRYATAADLEKIIEEVYGVGASSTASSEGRRTDSRRSSRLSRRRGRDRDKAEAAAASATKVGKEGKVIEKVISDERTNSLIVMATDEALEDVRKLIAQLDVDVDPASRAQIHVVYLEHAKAEDVAQVLANLSEGGSTSSRSPSRRVRRDDRSRRQPGRPGGPPFGAPGALGGEEGGGDEGGAVAAFESGVRITSDENTNSLVIIATPDQFRIIKQVIDRLDIPRRQVFVEAVILELGSDDSNEVGLGYHVGTAGADGSFNVFSAQLNGSSLGLSTDALSGMAVGLFGGTIDVPLSSGTGEATTISVPAFGVALQALQSNSAVNILSTPNILTMDNEEAKIVVGRNIPFPVSTGYDNNNNPIISYQREDVAITLKVTPQINESNFVTLEVYQEVQEIEEDNKGLDVTSAGFITSKRSIENTVVVRDNQTVVLGGLIGETDTEVETKIPLLGDLPVVGVLFRGRRHSTRRTNLLVFLTPHVIDDPSDLQEIYAIKWAQRKAFIERFYGKSRDEQERELARLLTYSMNVVDQPSRYRGPEAETGRFEVIDSTTGGGSPADGAGAGTEPPPAE